MGHRISSKFNSTKGERARVGLVSSKREVYANGDGLG